MSAAHTPGPWSRKRFESSEGVYSPSTAKAVAWIDGRTAEEADVNADLIAAAPELLDVLHTFPGFIDDAVVGDTWIEKMRAAIAKATGAAA